MCDTYIALSSATKDGSVIFGKNSDRLSNEAQLITYVPRTKHSDPEVKCTYISIPQVKETAAILMSQPYWMYGCEMGCSENNVVIGNEAVATKEPLKETGLLGMDLLRLGLERGKNAKDALKIIIDLLEKFGQGGAHNLKGLNYHNSMIIADLNEAYVLETAGEWWIVENVKNSRSISNHISIRGKGDQRKEGIIQHAIEKGYCKDDDSFDFKMIFSPSPLPEDFPLDSRDGCSLNQLSKHKAAITPELMMSFLREHKVGICMHRRTDTSVGSQVSQLTKEHKSIHWFTGSSIPCLSVYKPYGFPIKEQKVFEAKQYSKINQDWFWIRHQEYVKDYAKKPTKENPKRDLYQKTILRFEERLFTKLNNALNSKGDIDDLLIKELNELAWKQSEELIS